LCNNFSPIKSVKLLIREIDVAVTFWAYVWEALGMELGQNTGYPN
jgi:hypothetical protein